jgi:peptidylprolyl isomerase
MNTISFGERRLACSIPAGSASLVPALLLALSLGACATSPRATATATPEAAAAPAPAAALDGFVTLPNGLQYQDLVVGTGAQATSMREIEVHYVGRLADGTQFDSSRDRGRPLTFTLGRGEVIRGWDQGIRGMRAGGQRRLVIPPALAYGSAGSAGAIPPNATLVFDIELLRVR